MIENLEVIGDVLFILLCIVGIIVVMYLILWCVSKKD